MDGSFSTLLPPLWVPCALVDPGFFGDHYDMFCASVGLLDDQKLGSSILIFLKLNKNLNFGLKILIAHEQYLNSILIS